MRTVKSVFTALLALFCCAASADAVPAQKVLVIMLDGCRADAVFNANMPNLRNLAAGKWQAGYKAAYSFNAQVVTDAPTHSAPNHSSLATGVKAAKHHVLRNNVTKYGNFKEYPHFLSHLVDKYPDLKAAFFYVWAESGCITSNNPKVKYSCADDAKAVADAKKFIADGGDAVTLYINLPDAGGHYGGYYPHHAYYMNTLAQCDVWIGELLDVIAKRKNFANEDWLIAVTADHGGYFTSHGHKANTGSGSTIPLVISSKHVKSGRLAGTPYIFDVAPTAMKHFKLDPAAKGMDGTVLGDKIFVDPNAGAPLKKGFQQSVSFTGFTAADLPGKCTIQPYGGMAECLEFKKGAEVFTVKGSEKIKFPANNNFTLTFWAKYPKQSAEDPILVSNKSAADDEKAPGFVIYAARHGNHPFCKDCRERGLLLNVGSKTDAVNLSPYDRSDNWNFYAITLDANGTLIWANGAPDGYFYYMSLGAPDALPHSGKAIQFGGQGFEGCIDDIAIWNRGLSRDELEKIYRSGRGGTEIGTLVK